MERIEIPFNRWRLALYSFIMLLPLIAFTCYAVKNYNSAYNFWGWFGFIWWFILAALVGWVFLSYFLKLISWRSGLVITAEGVIDRTGFNNWGLIAWQDIYNVYGQRYTATYMIGLGTNAHKKYAARKNVLSAWFLLNNRDGDWGMRIDPRINASLLKCNPIQLESTLNAFLEKYVSAIKG